ncbi:SMP-30/gluconolactonase/LRE family protein [Seonamhaeicola maritimus]|uniref:SMP-30/gluconolactonase/LRE family protein n=1 Tax=Seonamhaeicola maritimus TaxID=2591822 RepID=UPI002494BD41|nr:SMP-30/gluconolactonase/LRE family protein [Seonamhaeicola maritimus]
MKISFNRHLPDFCTFFILLILILNLSCKTYKVENEKIIAAGATLTLVDDGFEFTEGPASDKNGNVYFTDQPNNRILKWTHLNNSVSEYMKPAGRSNGLYFDDSGNLLSAADEKNELWLIDSNKNTTVLINSFKNKKLNGPNDLWLKSEKGIYFTDPFYKRSWWTHDKQEQTSRCVYFLASNTKIPKIVDENFKQPNGLIGSPDGKTLYVSDIGDKKTYSYRIKKDGSLTKKTLFCNLGSDGMTIDNLGNVYLTGKGVTVFNSEGVQIEHITIPEKWTANVTFGGPNQNILFITAMDSVYTLEMSVTGVRYN